MPNHMIIRNANTPEDEYALKQLYAEVFHPEPVDELAEVFFNHLPGMNRSHWFLAEDTGTSTLCAGLGMIPWTWEMDGIPLRVAEQGLVGTRTAYRHRGLMRRLNEAFDQILETETYDLAVIQGIPGFYHNFGYYYAVALENHIELPLHHIPAPGDSSPYEFRRATDGDIPLLMKTDRAYRSRNHISVYRDEETWHYLLTHSLKTEYGSAFWIASNRKRGERIYFRQPLNGFGKGLIVSEISPEATHDALMALFSFCKARALKEEKPYIRLNLHNRTAAAQAAMALGARPGKPYGWQIKIPDPARLLKKMAPVLEGRIDASAHRGFTGTFRLDFYRSRLDLVWKGGRLAAVTPGEERRCEHTFFIREDLFPSLCLGRHGWRELNNIRPEVAPDDFYLKTGPAAAVETCGALVDVLFPKTVSWVYERY